MAARRGGVEYEPIQTLATVKGLGRVGWDALGQLLLVEFVVGRPDIDRPWPVALTREAAEQLLPVLQTCLAERGHEEGPVQ